MLSSFTPPLKVKAYRKLLHTFVCTFQGLQTPTTNKFEISLVGAEVRRKIEMLVKKKMSRKTTFFFEIFTVRLP